MFNNQKIRSVNRNSLIISTTSYKREDTRYGILEMNLYLISQINGCSYGGRGRITRWFVTCHEDSRAIESQDPSLGIFISLSNEHKIGNSPVNRHFNGNVLSA